jgi:hypothetical protein
MQPRTAAHAEQRKPALRGYRGVLTAILVFVASGAASLAFSGQARHQLAISFVRQPTHYTELYFSADRPREELSGFDVTTVRIPFTVVNHEGRPTTYPYVVEVLDPHQVPIGQAEGSVEVPDGTAWTTTVGVDVSVSAQWTALEVSLVGRPERLHLWRET